MDEYGELDQLLRDYLALPDVKVKYRPILGKKAADLRSITIAFPSEGEYQTHDIKDIEGFLKAYQADILNQDPLTFMFWDFEKNLGNINLSIEYYKDGGYSYYRPTPSEMILADFKNTIDFLIKGGIITEEQFRELQQTNNSVKPTW
jgi:hypothetical protein